MGNTQVPGPGSLPLPAEPMLVSQTVNGGIPPQTECPELLPAVPIEQVRDGPSHSFGSGDALPVAENLQCFKLCISQFDNRSHGRHGKARSV